MSKTDKDRPYWVKTYDSKVKNRRARHMHGTVPWTNGTHYDCDIDEFVKGRKANWHKTCDYVLPHNEYGDSVPKWYVDYIYHNPSRRDARDSLRAASKDWNANGDTDIEPKIYPDNNAAWLWS